jgi:hypothetical protein
MHGSVHRVGVCVACGEGLDDSCERASVVNRLGWALVSRPQREPARAGFTSLVLQAGSFSALPPHTPPPSHTGPGP